MSHNLTYNSKTGIWEMMSRGAAWHQLGQVVKDAQTWEDAISLAGLDWQIERRQLQYNGIDVPAWGLFRDDKFEPEESFLCPTTQTFEPLQNRECFAYLDALVESEGAHYEAAGSIDGGIRIFAVLNINEAFEVVPGDRHETYLTLLEDRSGKRSAKCFLTDLRTVCANTYESNYSSTDADNTVTFTHRENIRDKMMATAAMFLNGKMGVKDLQAKLNWLAGVNVTAETIAALLDRMFGENGKANRESVLSLFESNDNNTFPEIRGTAYNLLNAVTEYVDHVQPVRITAARKQLPPAQIRSARALFGDGASSKSDVADFLIDAVKAQKNVAMAAV